MSSRGLRRAPKFSVDPAPLSGVPGLHVRGVVDISTGRDLTAAIDAAIAESVGAFVIDLCDVDFLDSTGVNVVLHARAALGRDDRQLVLICPPGSVRRVFDVVGISDLLVFFATRDEAAASLKPTA